MGRKNKYRKFWQELENPHILTLDEALALTEQPEEPENPFMITEPEARVIDAILVRISTRYSGPHNVDVLTYGERMVVEVTALMDSAYQGGIAQYLFDAPGDAPERTKSMLRNLLAFKTVSILDRVSRIFPLGRIPKDTMDRWAALEQYEETHPDTDLFGEVDLLYQESEENLHALLIEYIRDHKQEFAQPADEIVRKFKRKRQVQEYFGVADDPEALEDSELAF